MAVLIPGCGFTGRRVAQLLLARDPAQLADLGVTAIRADDLRDHVRAGMRVVHSIPPDAMVFATTLIRSKGKPRRPIQPHHRLLYCY